jgi:hypothetical protein
MTATPASLGFATYARAEAQRAFSVLYAGEVTGSEGDLLWRRADGTDRWDFFYQRKGAEPGMDAMARSGNKPAGACSIYFDSPTAAKVACLAGAVGSEFNETFVTPFALLSGDMKFVGYREIIGHQTACFRADLGIRLAAEICLTQDGLPLSIDVSFGVSQASVHATTINAAPSDTDLTTLPWNQQTGLNLVNVAVSKLVFPPIPALQDYLTKS